MTVGDPPARVAVKCERHGLHYNPVSQTGCARCRREAAETTVAATPAEAARLRNAWLAALLLIAATALGLFLVEGSLVRSLVPFVDAEPVYAPPPEN